MATSRAIVAEKLRNVLDLMSRNGFEINQPVDLAVDENLPFMGYTSRRWQRHLIVVSGSAVGSPMLEGLLAHELSHVYRTLTNHPSHNEKIIAEAVGSLTQLQSLDEDYQAEVLHQAINHIQDLYADDIAVKVLMSEQDRAAVFEGLGEFFLDWIKEEPVNSGSRQKNAWANAGILLNNCFAVSNIQRRKVSTVYEKAKSVNEKFLLRITPSAANNFRYFNRFMVNLKEDVSEQGFKEELQQYLGRFWDVVQTI